MRTARPLLLVAALLASAAADAAEIRFYRINDKGQLYDVRFVHGRDDPGCHSMPAARSVHRVAVIGYAACRLYAERGCKPGSELPALWKKKPGEGSIRLTPGSRWFLHPTDNRKVASFDCEE